MENPILRMLRQNNNANSMPMLKSIIGAKNPNEMFDNMMRTNPQFAQFVEQNKGRSPQEIARAYGIDPSILKF